MTLAVGKYARLSKQPSKSREKAPTQGWIHLRRYVLEQFDTKDAILAIDEASFPKRGTRPAGVQVQYCEITGQIEHCQEWKLISVRNMW